MKEKENILVDENNGFTLWGALMHGCHINPLVKGVELAWHWSKELAKAAKKKMSPEGTALDAVNAAKLRLDQYVALRARLNEEAEEAKGTTRSYAVLTQLSRKRMKKGHNRLIHPAGAYWLLADANGKRKLRTSGFYQFVDDISTEGYKIGDVVVTHKFAEINYIVS